MRRSQIPAALVALLCVIGRVAAALPVGWFVELDANPGWIAVQVDARQLRSNEVLRDVRVDVGFFDDRGRFLGSKTFHLTDQQFPALRQELYVRYFPHGFARVARVTGNRLSVKEAGPVGEAFDTRENTVPSLENPIAGQPMVIGEFPPTFHPDDSPGQSEDVAPDVRRDVVRYDIPGGVRILNKSWRFPYCVEIELVREEHGAIVERRVRHFAFPPRHSRDVPLDGAPGIGLSAVKECPPGTVPER